MAMEANGYASAGDNPHYTPPINRWRTVEIKVPGGMSAGVILDSEPSGALVIVINPGEEWPDNIQLEEGHVSRFMTDERPFFVVKNDERGPAEGHERKPADTGEAILSGRNGDWLQMGDGRKFYPFDPRQEEVRIEDIASALSKLCRFGGHCREFYSVAQHSVHVSELCSPGLAMDGLLHDAAEAYLIDLPRPIKRHPSMAAYRAAERRLTDVIALRFGINPILQASVERADEVMLATEARDLMGSDTLERWSSLADIQPLPSPIVTWVSSHAERVFLKRFRELARGEL